MNYKATRASEHPHLSGFHKLSFHAQAHDLIVHHEHYDTRLRLANFNSSIYTMTDTE
jgi:hypothetical protein